MNNSRSQCHGYCRRGRTAVVGNENEDYIGAGCIRFT